MIDAKTSQFIAKHRMEDVRRLALSAAKADGVDMKMALQQIAGWQQARLKIASWADNKKIVYPPHLNMEQCSSEATALYKAALVERWRGDEMVDLTGGLGVDFSFLSRHFKKATYVERDPMLCQIAEHNLQALEIANARVVCADSSDFIGTVKHVRLIYLDPARRDVQGKKTYAMSDCTPDITLLAPTLLTKVDVVLVKLSPMLDWHAAVDLLPHVAEVHIVSVHGECKELLVLMTAEVPEKTSVKCVNDQQTFVFDAQEADEQPVAEEVLPGMLLVEPNASVMKSGAFGILCSRYGLKAVAENSHLFVGEEAGNYPGRTFTIMAVSSMNKRQIKEKLAGVAQANIAVRNFPMSADALRKRLRLNDGGDTYIFGTTLNNGEHALIICKK